MKILGNRVLVSKVEEEKKEGFQTVEVQDSFVYKGRVEQIECVPYVMDTGLKAGDIILFTKYSPDAYEVEEGGKKMKIMPVTDILAIL